MKRNTQLVLFLLGLSSLIVAQDISDLLNPVRGTVKGVVTDHLGARIMKAAVIVLNIQDQKTTQVTTGPDGVYRVAVSPGVYTLSVTAQHFYPLDRAPFRIQTGQTLKFDFELPVRPIEHCVDLEGVPAKCAPLFTKEKITISANPKEPLDVQLFFGTKHGEDGDRAKYEGFHTGSRLAVILTYDPLTIKAKEIQITRDPPVFEARGKVTIQFMGADMNADAATLRFAGTIPLVDAQGMELVPPVNK
jgi:hypothetical protein